MKATLFLYSSGDTMITPPVILESVDNKPQLRRENKPNELPKHYYNNNNNNNNTTQRRYADSG